ncbi:hypothetical protein QQ73_13395, partial [Candidatus Endoriftia persephone str. Guaymas]|nr:hypothetical protein [Candidatus Endoriftia persephone str. Guaymas]
IHNKGLMQALRQYPELLKHHMELAVLRSVKEIARDARRNAPKAYNTLTHSITQRSLYWLNGAVVGEVVAGMDYAQMVEEGTGPGGWPSDRTMLDWIHAKHIEPHDATMDEWDLAFLLARSIALHGTPAQPYLKPALQNNKAKAERRISRAINAALKEMGR